ncbi:hypothetical protein BDN67DRAFT_1013585 [Paxillus ammoniavirescens]|nr:hypothetical protein BDN67DRAFT_1013585 [Paxillus ammoniavirescens]
MVLKVKTQELACPVLAIMSKSTCAGKNKDGSECPCRRYKPRRNQKEDEPDLCHNCGHFDTSHPELPSILEQSSKPIAQPSNISNLITNYTHLLKTKASEDIARKETNDGFRKKTDAGGKKIELRKTSTSKALFKSQKETEADIRDTAIGTVVFIVVGLDESCSLRKPAAPDKAKIELLRGSGLVVTCDASQSPIRLRRNMSQSDVDQYLRTLFPKLFEYMDDEDGPTEAGYSWVLLIKSRTSLTVSSKGNLSGADILDSRTPGSRKWELQSVYLGTVPKIHTHTWRQWNPFVIVSDNETSEDDAPGRAHTQPTTRSMSKGKKRERTASPAVELDESEAEFEGIMMPAISTKSTPVTGPDRKKRKVMFGEKELSKLSINDDDDDKEIVEIPVKSTTAKCQQRTYSRKPFMHKHSHGDGSTMEPGRESRPSVAITEEKKETKGSTPEVQTDDDSDMNGIATRSSPILGNIVSSESAPLSSLPPNTALHANCQR